MTAAEFNRLIKVFKHDKIAFDKVFNTFMPKLKKYMTANFLGQLGNAECEDIAQQVFLKFFKNPPQEKVTAPVCLFQKMLRNAAFTAIKKNSRTTELTEQINYEVNYDDYILKADTERALKKLDHTTREIIIMNAEGFSLVEISEELGLSYDNVRKRASRGRKRLKELCHITPD